MFNQNVTKTLRQKKKWEDDKGGDGSGESGAEEKVQLEEKKDRINVNPDSIFKRRLRFMQ